MPRLSLPSPRRTVRQGVRVCRRMGYSDPEALLLIMCAAKSAADVIVDLGEYDTTWVMSIHGEAAAQLQRHSGGDE